ncbi:MAG TPA: hypothetical protein VN456_18185 [Desulfosporosinus sp.]|nr:hypothetical protein [Desulfosporosinus sp.]
MSLKQITGLLEEIVKKLDALNVRPTLLGDASMFAGFYKGKIILVCTDSLLWTGGFQHVENDFIVLSNATAVSASTGINIISTPQILVEIPLLKITSVSIGVSTQKNAVNSQVDPLSENQSNLWQRV